MNVALSRMSGGPHFVDLVCVHITRGTPPPAVSCTATSPNILELERRNCVTRDFRCGTHYASCCDVPIRVPCAAGALAAGDVLGKTNALMGMCRYSLPVAICWMVAISWQVSWFGTVR